jgi:hypothetical protein
MDSPAVVRLELWLDGESPTGRAIAQRGTAGGEEERGFAGWLGLVAAVEGLVRGDRAGGPEQLATAPDEQAPE